MTHCRCALPHPTETPSDPTVGSCPRGTQDALLGPQALRAAQSLLSPGSTSGTYTSVEEDSRGAGGMGSLIRPDTARRTARGARDLSAGLCTGEEETTSRPGSRALRRPAEAGALPLWLPVWGSACVNPCRVSARSTCKVRATMAPNKQLPYLPLW